MNFKEFYEQENLMEFSDSSRDSSMSKVSSGLGSIASGISKFISGSFKKAWSSLPISQTLKDMAEKGDKAIEIAKIIYPYPEEKVKYDELKKEGKHKDSKMIASFFTQAKLEQSALTPIGLVLVYKTYNAVVRQVRAIPELKNAKISMQSLLEAAQDERIRFPKFKDLKAVDEYMSREDKQGSLWHRWKGTASQYSAWKNLYDNVDSESEKSIVSDLESLHKTSKQISDKIAELEDKNMEVNAMTIKQSFAKETDDVVNAIIEKLKVGSATYATSTGVEKDEEDIRLFLNTLLLRKFVVSKYEDLLANMYVTTSLLLEKNKLEGWTPHSVFSSYDSFISLFQNVNGFDKINFQGSSRNRNTYIKEFLQLYMNMNGKDGVEGKHIDDTFIQAPPQKIYDLIYKNLKTIKQQG